MTKYTVGVREVHVRFYEVRANSPVEAKQLVNERGSNVTDLEFEEFSHELEKEAWSVEEKV